MKTPMIFGVALGSALVGGVVGASFTRWMARLETPAAEERPGEARVPEAVTAPATASIEERLAAVERSLRAMERRRAFGERVTAAASGNAERRAPEPERALVDDPVFEAAVVDILERAEEGRASEREARREERRKAQVDRWATELTQLLGLTPDQRTKLVEIRTGLQSDLRQRLEGDGGVELPRSERRARAEALRAEADRKLAAVLDGRQMAAYAKLEPELQLWRRPPGAP